jgi:hypothetical protein
MPSVVPMLERESFKHSMALWCDVYWIFCAQFSAARVRNIRVIREIVSFLRWSLTESHSAEVMASAEYALGEHLFDRPEIRKHLPRFFEIADIDRLEERLRVWNRNAGAKFDRCYSKFVRAKRKKPNQALEPTRVLVTDRADARSAPSTRVAHL